MASKIVDKLGKEIIKSPKKHISKIEQFAEKVLEEDELSLIESFRHSPKTRKSPARQEVCQEHQGSSEEILEQRSEQPSLQQECLTQNDNQTTEQVDEEQSGQYKRRVSRDMQNIFRIGLPQFVHPPLLQKRPEILNGRVGTLFFNYQISEKSVIKTIEQKLNTFKQDCLPLDDDQISWETLKSKGQFTIGEISKLKTQGMVKISASFFVQYAKQPKQLYHKLMFPLDRPSKMLCSFSYIDPKKPLQSSFISVSPTNKYIGFVIGEIIDNCPIVNEQIEKILLREKMTLLNAIQLLCIFKDRVFGALKDDDDYELAD